MHVKKIFLVLLLGVGGFLYSTSSFAEDMPKERKENLKVIAEKLHTSQLSEKAHKMNLQMIKRYESILKDPTLEENKRAMLMFRLAEKYTVEGEYYFHMIKMEQAKKWINKSIKLYQNILQQTAEFTRIDEVLYSLGMSFLKTEEKSKASKYFKQLIKEHPKSKYIQPAKTQLQKL